MDYNHGIEWVREGMRQLGEQLTKVQDSVADVRERLIMLEANTLHTVVEGLQKQLTTALARIDVLEADKDARKGAQRGLTTAADWLYKIAPWIFATALVVVANIDKV